MDCALAGAEWQRARPLNEIVRPHKPALSFALRQHEHNMGPRMPHHAADPSTLALQALATEEKFLPLGLYSGAKPEEQRARLQQLIDALLTELAALAPNDRTKEQVLERFRSTLASVGNVDSEEKEQVCSYLARTMDILGLESSDGLLNNWLYDFDLDALLRSRASEA
jgi:hypothetical protein